MQLVWNQDTMSCPEDQTSKGKLNAAGTEKEGVIYAHFGLWQVEPRLPPRIPKAEPLYTESWIDHACSQVPPPGRGLYRLTLIENSRYVFGADKCIAPPFLFEGRL
jgi:hypothetical protein